MAKARAKEELTGVGRNPGESPGNFEQIEAYLRQWRKQVSKMEITGSDM
jgi:hypothetical protein